jgi:hypothetical protein
METCSECGASVAEEDESCPSCGKAAVVNQEAQRFEVLRNKAADESGIVLGGKTAEEDASTTVPAGTWASTSDSPRRSVPDQDTRHVRRFPTGDGIERTEMRGDHTAMVQRMRTETRRSGALAIANAPDEAEPLRNNETLKEGRLVAFPSAREDSSKQAKADRSSDGPSSRRTTQNRPIWLASELLRERLPAEPYARVSRVLAVAAGVGGALFTAFFGVGENGAHLGIAGLLVAIAIAALAPLEFRMRAAAFAVLASIGLVIATTSVKAGPGADVFGLATLGTTLLAAAQLLRSIHRTSKFARAAMGLGIAVSASWLLLTGGLDAMVVQGTDWSAWFEPGVRALLLVVLALSLLGFLDDTGGSGCHVWPWLVLGWGGVRAVFGLLIEGTGSEVAILAAALFGSVAALGWMQVWATTPQLGPVSKYT